MNIIFKLFLLRNYFISYGTCSCTPKPFFGSPVSVTVKPPSAAGYCSSSPTHLQRQMTSFDPDNQAHCLLCRDLAVPCVSASPMGFGCQRDGFLD